MQSRCVVNWSGDQLLIDENTALGQIMIMDGLLRFFFSFICYVSLQDVGDHGSPRFLVFLLSL